MNRHHLLSATVVLAAMPAALVGQTAPDRDPWPRIWERAQTTGGVLAFEPDTHVVGPIAATKKTWELADRFLKLFWGSEPIWYPTDIIRRSTCADDVRWSYFWHDASGDERDLHAWLHDGFDPIMGRALAQAFGKSGAADVSSCADVGGTASPCLYGEVTPPKSFDKWFCGGTKNDCLTRLAADPYDVNDAFARRTACVMGPFVEERIHGGRPEIHPAEVLWSLDRNKQDWRFAILPDRSGRYDKAKYFTPIGKSRAKGSWSGKRPVELWVAFAHPRNAPVTFDFARRCIAKRSEKHMHVDHIDPPAPGAPFKDVPTGIKDLGMSIGAWEDGDQVKGLVVLRSPMPPEGCEAVVMALAARAPGAPTTDLGLTRIGPGTASAAMAEVSAPAPRFRIRAVDHVTPLRSKAGRDEFLVETLAGFAAGVATQEPDEARAAKLNDELRRDERRRRETFGVASPFTIDWDVKAFRIDTGEEVPVRVGPVLPGNDPAVSVVTRLSPLTQSISVNREPPVAAAGLSESGLTKVAGLSLSIPAGVRVTAKGTIRFIGQAPGLIEKTAGLGFAVPPAADEWRLIHETLSSLDSRTADGRRDALRALACQPLGPGCSLSDLSTAASAGLRGPTMIDTLKTLEDPQRTFARYVWLLATAFVQDGSVTSTEADNLRLLLDAACAPGDDTAPAAFCRDTRMN